MNYLKLKKYLPRSFFGRTLLIIILPIIILEAIIGFAFIQRYFEQVTTQLAKSTVLQMNYVLDRHKNTPNDAKELFFKEMEEKFDINLTIVNKRNTSNFFQKHPYDFSGITLIKILKNDVPNIEHIDLKSNGIVKIITSLPNKSYLKFEIERERFTASNPHQLLVLMVLLTIILGFLLLMVLRNQIKPIKTLASVAEAFGKGQSLGYKPTGSIEIRKAGSAFLEMRKRLERQIEQRTQMLSGVSHDLRTPLTRLKLALTLKEEDIETQEMLKDIQVMQNILDEFLEFSKNQQTEKVKEISLIDLYDFLKSNSKNLQEKLQWQSNLKNHERKVRLRPNNLSRALNNLIENAVFYGSQIKISVIEKNARLLIHIEDNGPGIPSDKIKEAVKPFVRLDNSRNLNKPHGVGLGLSIASDLIKSHGGNLHLKKSPELGGLKASLTLPL
ncbi:ATP-binding protein [Paracoccaceae bacterium]|nr:ATP-binding protein [Paracoccaceae bacterium]